MGKLRPVSVKFQMPENKIIPFTMICDQKNSMLKASQEEYGYASDMIFLDLYAAEVAAVLIPSVSHYKPKNYSQWCNQISELKTDVKIWQEDVSPTIRSKPKILADKVKDIEYWLSNSISPVENIIWKLDHKRPVEDLDIEFFYRNMNSLLEEVKKPVSILNDLKNKLTDYTVNLNAQNESLIKLSETAAEMTEEQKKQIEKIEAQIRDYQSSRKAAIAGAAVTGVLAGAAIAGGIVALKLIPGVGEIILGLGVFAALILGVGTVACTRQAINLKECIENEEEKKDNIVIERDAIILTGDQFGGFADETKELVHAVEDIWENWNDVANVVWNINNFAQRIKVEGKQAPLTEWQAVNNDLHALEKIIESLKEAIATMDLKTEIYTDCDLTGCSTEEEILERLKEFTEEKSGKNAVS